MQRKWARQERDEVRLNAKKVGKKDKYGPDVFFFVL